MYRQQVSVIHCPTTSKLWIRWLQWTQTAPVWMLLGVRQHSTALGAGERAQGKEVKNFNPSMTNLVEFLPEIEDGGKFIRPDFSVKFAASCDRSSQDPELGDNLSEESTSQWVTHAGREHAVWQMENAHTHAILGSLSFCLNKTVQMRISILKLNIATVVGKAAFYAGSTHCATMNASQPLFLFSSNSTMLFISIDLNLTVSKY